MAEMAVAIMVVSLPSMRAYLRRGGIFASKRTYGSSSSNPHRRTSIDQSSHLKLSSNNRSKHSGRIHADEEDSGSEVELNVISRKDVIYETRRISVQFSDPIDDGHTHDKHSWRSGDPLGLWPLHLLVNTRLGLIGIRMQCSSTISRKNLVRTNQHLMSVSASSER